MFTHDNEVHHEEDHCQPGDKPCLPVVPTPGCEQEDRQQGYGGYNKTLQNDLDFGPFAESYFLHASLTFLRMQPMFNFYQTEN
jgi:hypothetical protein